MTDVATACSEPTIPALTPDSLAQALLALSSDELLAFNERVDALREAALQAEAERAARELQGKRDRLLDFVTNELKSDMQELGFMLIPAPEAKQPKPKKSAAKPAAKAAKPAAVKAPKVLLKVLKTDRTIAFTGGRCNGKGRMADGETMDPTKWRDPTKAEKDKFARDGKL